MLPARGVAKLNVSAVLSRGSGDVIHIAQYAVVDFLDGVQWRKDWNGILLVLQASFPASYDDGNLLSLHLVDDLPFYPILACHLHLDILYFSMS